MKNVCKLSPKQKEKEKILKLNVLYTGSGVGGEEERGGSPKSLKDLQIIENQCLRSAGRAAVPADAPVAVSHCCPCPHTHPG